MPKSTPPYGFGFLLFSVVVLSLLTGLGVWQLRRLTWKEGILADIARAEQMSPVPLTAEATPYRKVVVAGRLRFDLAALYGAEVRDLPSGTALGSQAIVPLERSGGEVLVDLGWLPEGQRASGLPEAEIVGYVRPPEHPGWFSAADDVTGRRFYTLDPAKIGAALGLRDVAPFVVVAMEPANWGAIPAEHLPRPPNNHLSYAVTWFGLAGALVVMFATWSRGAQRP